MTATILAEIRTRITDEARERRSVTDPQYIRNLRCYRQLQDQAAAEFGRINGWRVAKRFHVHRLGWATNNDYRCYPLQAWADHALHYRAPRTDGRRGWLNAAVVEQPYSMFDGVAEELDALREKGLAVHLPPRPKASIYYPGTTLFIVVTKPGIVVNWLPEQMEAEPVAALATAT